MSITNQRSAPASPCFPWCDHDDRLQGEHTSAEMFLPIPDAMADAGVEDILTVFLGNEDGYGTGVSVNSGDNGAVMTPAEVETFADSLIAFAAQIRQMGRRATEQRAGYDTEAADR